MACLNNTIRMENGNVEGSDPSSFLTEIIGSTVKVKLNSGVEYTGKIQLDLVALRLELIRSRPTVFNRWIHEPCNGKDEGIRNRVVKKRVWRLLYSW